jgi:hypothetical protein
MAANCCLPVVACKSLTHVFVLGVVNYLGDVRVSGYTWTPALASLPPRDASTAEAAGRGDGGDEGEGLEVQEVEEWPEERAAAHTTAVLTVPALVGAVAYAGAVWRGLAVFPPPARSFYSFAELLPVRAGALLLARLDAPWPCCSLRPCCVPFASSTLCSIVVFPLPRAHNACMLPGVLAVQITCDS